MRFHSTIFALVALLIGGSVASHAAQPLSSNRPDILILDFASSTGMETINLTYPATVPHSQVKRDIASLQQSLGAQFSEVHIEDAPPPIQGDHTMMTSARFMAIHALANTPNTVAVEPLIMALKPYKHMSVHYFVASGFKFQGLRDYTDKYVTIAFTPSGATYSYDIRINDPSFTRLNLPIYVVDPAAVQVAAAPATAPATKHGPWIVLAIFVGALALGGVVYTVLTRYF